MSTLPQDMELEKFLGVDMGGTNVKMGVVDKMGNVHDFQSFPTSDWRNSPNFTGKMMDAIAYKFLSTKEIYRVGIGIPGLLSKDRRSPLEIPAIPELNGVPLQETLERRFKEVRFRMENDANAAALGEFYFGNEETGESFIFATMGTGIGGAAILNNRLFNGGDGNSMEFGHIVSRHGKRLEQNIGKQGILGMAAQRFPAFTKKEQTQLSYEDIQSASKLVVAAGDGDPLAVDLFREVGNIMAEGLITTIRILDVKSIMIGGGLSASFEVIYEGLMEVFEAYLTPYYLEELSVTRATLGNDAGILGAASLCFID